MIKILIVDDSEHIRNLFKRVLSGKNFEVFTSEIAAKGLESFKENNPDLAILDMDLPDMDGKEFLKKIRERSDTVPIILLTGSDDFDQKNLPANTFFMSKSLGISPVLEKIDIIVSTLK